MDDSKLLKETHPQKYYLKLLCRFIYYLGSGDCWYEVTVRSRTHKILYGIWSVIINGYIILNTLNECLAHLRSELLVDEKSDLIQFSFAHPSLCLKYIILVFQKDRIRDLFERMMEGTRSLYFSLENERASVKKAMLYTFSLVGVTYATIFTALVAGIKTHFDQGYPIRTEVVLYPARSDTGLFVNLLRFMVELHWWCIVTNMLVVDGLSIFSLTYLGFKFKLVRLYFDDLRKKTLSNLKSKSKLALKEEFEKDFKLGIKLHEEALWCSRNVQYALGNIYSVQIFESITLLVMCLVRTVTNERNMAVLLAIMVYIACLFVLTGAYCTSAGDVTYQASKVGTSIFHCGWEMVPVSKSLRSMAVVAIERSQTPVYMTAFGVIILSHSNYIAVIRSSYSFFAVMY